MCGSYSSSSPGQMSIDRHMPFGGANSGSTHSRTSTGTSRWLRTSGESGAVGSDGAVNAGGGPTVARAGFCDAKPAVRHR
jgi:hypothetical protein